VINIKRHKANWRALCFFFI